MHKIIRRISKIVLTVCSLILLYVAICFGKFFYNEQHTSVVDVLEGKNVDNLTILYRPDCPRCQKILPWLILREGLVLDDVKIVNAQKLSKDQRKGLGVEVLPTFVYRGQALNTMNHQEILDLIYKVRSDKAKKQF